MKWKNQTQSNILSSIILPVITKRYISRSLKLAKFYPKWLTRKKLTTVGTTFWNYFSKKQWGPNYQNCPAQKMYTSIKDHTHSQHKNFLPNPTKGWTQPMEHLKLQTPSKANTHWHSIKNFSEEKKNGDMPMINCTEFND